jgi:aspartate kinase
MKFGGTSVEDATAIRRLISIVRRQSHRRPVVVVSAMGRTTNGLLECARLAAAGELGSAQSKLDEIAAHHFKSAEQLALRKKSVKRASSCRVSPTPFRQTGNCSHL